MDVEWVVQIVVYMVKCLLLMMVVILELICCGCYIILVDELCCEFDMMMYVFVEGDGIEGICVFVVDKDYVFKWKYISIDVVCDDEVIVFFVLLWCYEQYLLLGLLDQNW